MPQTFSLRVQDLLGHATSSEPPVGAGLGGPCLVPYFRLPLEPWSSATLCFLCERAYRRPSVRGRAVGDLGPLDRGRDFLGLGGPLAGGLARVHSCV